MRKNNLKYNVIAPYARQILVKFDKELSVKQQSESLGFVTQVLTVNWLSFPTIKNTFEPFISLKK